MAEATSFSKGEILDASSLEVTIADTTSSLLSPPQDDDSDDGPYEHMDAMDFEESQYQVGKCLGLRKISQIRS